MHSAAQVMLDHPSWSVADDGTGYRAVRTSTGVWLAVAGTDGVTFELLAGHGQPPVADLVDPAQLRVTAASPFRPPMLAGIRELQAAGAVARLRNPDLWDALATSIVRQVIRAGHARELYRRFAAEHGDHFSTEFGVVAVFPSPETVLSLDDAEFGRLGLAFKREPLRAAAEAFGQCGQKWTEVDPPTLTAEVQRVRRIGPWTAGATVADVTNNYRHYPFADLAVRTWAERLMPEATWPKAEPEFAQVWREAAHEQLSDWTLLTLAWGVRHARGVAI